jgi:predicted nuclease of restriction endonuclease-like (RecB) superfamily
VQKNLPSKKNSHSNLDLRITKNSVLAEDIGRVIFGAQGLKAQRCLIVGFLIAAEVRKGNQNYINVCAAAVPDLCARNNQEFSSSAELLEALHLYSRFCRFVPTFKGTATVLNIRLPVQITLEHLVLIARHCKTVLQEDIFLVKIVRYMLSPFDLETALLSGLSSGIKNAVVTVDDLTICTHYNLASLKFDAGLSENQTKAHIIDNIAAFTEEVLNSNWGFLPDQTIYAGGRQQYLDLVFYNSILNRYCILDLKTYPPNVACINRAKAQMSSYVAAFDRLLNLEHQRRTIGLILGKEPIDSVYFHATETPDLLYYAGFTV